jgi:predicted RNA-binding protein YlqC (UPF0109 family)
MRQITDVLAALARGLVDRPEAVRVHERSSGDETILELEVDPEDRGRVIGRGGETIRAVRRLLETLARKRGKRCRVEVAE